MFRDRVVRLTPIGDIQPGFVVGFPPHDGMARANEPNSANSQFFIMYADGSFLNCKYTVVGEVVSGMDVVDKIKQVKTGSKNGMQDVPVTPVIIKKATLEQ